MPPNQKGGKEKILSSQVVYRGRYIGLRLDEIALTSGARIVTHTLEHPGSVGIVPILDDGRIVLIRQLRRAIGRKIWEIPAGTLEEGEDPAECAARELEEEAGYKAAVIEHLFDVYISPGYSSEMMRVFVARSLRKTKQGTEEDEVISVEAVPKEKVMKMIATEMTDAKTIAAITYFFSLGEEAQRRRRRPHARRGA